MEYDIGHILHCGDSLGWIVDKCEDDGTIVYKVDWSDGWDYEECWYEQKKIDDFTEHLYNLCKAV